MVLSQEEIDGCREAFLAFDKDRSGKFTLSLSLITPIHNNNNYYD